MQATKKFGAFGGATWRIHDEAIKSGGQPSPNPGVGSARTLKLTVKPDSKELKSMIVQIDGTVSAVTEVLPKGRKERLLVAAQLEAEDFLGETDDVARKVTGMKTIKRKETPQIPSKEATQEGVPDKGEQTAAKTVEASLENVDDAGDNNNEADIESKINKGEEASHQDAAATRREDLEQDGTLSGSNPAGEPKPPKMRILELRAQAMADLLAEDLSRFRMPKDFH